MATTHPHSGSDSAGLSVASVAHPAIGTSGFQARLVDEWIEILGRVPWQWFATLTFKGGGRRVVALNRVHESDLVHPERADKAFRVWRSKIARAVHGPRWSRVERKYGAGVSFVRATEFQRRGTLHYHALLAGVGEFNRLQAMDLWTEITEGYARIEPPENAEAVRRYVCKYLLKANAELDFGGPAFVGSRLVLPELPRRRLSLDYCEVRAARDVGEQLEIRAEWLPGGVYSAGAVDSF